jgi:hypothetical protein
MPAASALDRTGSRILITASTYSLELPDAALALHRAPIARLRDAAGRKWSDLSLLSSVHARGSSDETIRILSIDVHEDGDAVELRVVASSSIWRERRLTMRCLAERIETRIEVDGTAPVTDVTLFGGRGAMPNAASGEFRSDIRFLGVLVPAATEPVQLVRPSTSPAALSVIGDADAGRLNAVFSPPPLALGFSREKPRSATEPPAGDWLALWARSPVNELTMTAMRYLPLDGGFLVRFDYEGHTVCDGTWVSPVVVLEPADAGWDVLDRYRADLVAHGFAPDGPASAPADWWREPIFCGWGAQCARAAHDLHGDDRKETPDDEVEAVRSAPALAREDVYDELLATLAANDLEPGTIVIDDRWQSSYGTGEVDTAHWPDLRAWIDARHAEGRKVLLWWKAWDAEGIPAEECVRNAADEPVSVDPGNPAYRARLAGIIRHLLSPEGLDADGFKIDFTQRGPSGESLTGTDGVWGIAALHLLLSTLADAARAIKPDALLIAHAVHPSFGDICSMVRLNDVSKRDPYRRRVPVVQQLAMRHAIASRALPHHLIDTDQWPMPNRAEWLSYAEAQPGYGVPALYYVEAIDRSGERIGPGELQRVAATWRRYREGMA